MQLLNAPVYEEVCQPRGGAGRMIKTATPSVRQIVAMALFALCSFGAMLYLWLAFGGAIPLKPKGYRFDVVFPEATTLAEQAEVRISGVPVGKVVDRRGLRRQRRAGDDRAAPTARRSPKDTRAMLRIKTLLGETYVELTPGHPDKGTLPEGATLARLRGRADRRAGRDPAHVRPPRRARTSRRGCSRRRRRWTAAASTSTRRSGCSPGFVERDRPSCSRSSTRSSLRVRETVASTGEVFDAISEREGDLRGLITDAERLFSTTGARNERARGDLRGAAALRAREPRGAAELTELARGGRARSCGSSSRPRTRWARRSRRSTRSRPSSTASSPSSTRS